MRELRDYDWNTAAQAYGILSRFAFLIKHSGMENVDHNSLEAYIEAEHELQQCDTINSQAFEILIEAIKNYTGANYRLDILDEIDEDDYYDGDCDCCEDDDDKINLNISIDGSKITEEQSEILSSMFKAINIVAKHFEKGDE